MNFAEAHAILRRVTYKPRIEFEMDDLGDDFVTLRIMAQVANVNPPHGLVPLFRCVTVPHLSYLDESAFLHFLSRAIYDFECHEVDEWLRLDGECVHEPHPERTYAGLAGLRK